MMGGVRQGATERRAHPREEIAATANVICEGRCSGPMMVANLSAGGASLAGDTFAVAGKSVRLLLQLEGRAPIGLQARVLRTERTAAGTKVAVAFVHVSAQVEDRIHEAVLSNLEGPPPPGPSD